MTPKKRTSARPSNSAPGHGKRHVKGSASGPNKSSKGPGGSATSAGSGKRPGSSNAPNTPNASNAPGRPAKGGLGPRKTDNFSKFYNKKRNSAIKEGFRQEKKAAKKERKAAIELHFEQRRQSRGYQPPTHSTGKGPFRPDAVSPSKGPLRPDAVSPSKGPFRPDAAAPSKAPFRPVAKGPIPSGSPVPDTPGVRRPKGTPHPATVSPKALTPQSAKASGESADQLPLNKYIAHGGICSRRDAAELIRQGKVTVNGQPVTEPGTKVSPTDLVKVGGKKVTISRNFVYILLNKPKDYITTTDDPQGRRTVLDLIRQATTERVYPVGRLDRNTSGVLLLTNDGDLSQKLAHPSHQIKKIYHVTLDKPLTRADFEAIAGDKIVLEDGPAHVDVMAYADPKDKTQIGLEIHSGRNRIVRRIFEHLGYDVRGLDRVMYAGLTKKNVQRGHWRLLSEKEVRVLKYLNSSIKGSAARAKDLTAGPAVPPPASKTITKAPIKARTPARDGTPAKSPHASRPPHKGGAPRPFQRKKGE
jgi:23S rRNA pseudouridine2605 synthase